MVNALHKTSIRILSGSRYQLLRTLEERGFRGQDQSVFRELFQCHSSQLSILTRKIIGSNGYIYGRSEPSDPSGPAAGYLASCMSNLPRMGNFGPRGMHSLRADVSCLVQLQRSFCPRLVPLKATRFNF